MNFSAEILNELKEISPLLATIEKHNVFSVPDDYFNTLSLEVIKRSVYADYKDQAINGQSVPDGYFEGLSQSVLNKIKSAEQSPAEELKALSPMLYSIQNENVYTVPAGYFKNIENTILHTVNPPKAKIVEFKKIPIWKYAAAAIATGVIALSSLITFNSSRQPADKTLQVAVSTSIKTAAQYKNEQQINAAIATLSDDDIIKYLEKTGTDNDNETLASGIDAKSLPRVQDYLANENILQQYLRNDKNSQN